MSKFLLNLLLQISKALVNSEIQFLIRKFFFLAFGPADLAATRPSAQPAPAGLSSLAGQRPQAGPSRSARAHRWRNCRSALSPLIHAFRLAPSLYPPLTQGSHVSAPSSPPRRPTAVRNPLHRRSLCAAAPRLGCRRAFIAPPHHSPPLIPFKPSHNEA
jgi:hypothetical protein